MCCLPTPWLLVVFILLTTASTGCSRTDEEASVPRSQPGATDHQCPGCNVVLVSIDTLRADRLSLYGNTRPTSPNLDRLGGEGVVFDAFFYSGGGTLPSHMSMMTSLNPAVHGLRAQQSQTPLPEARVTLAEVLTEAGYRTAAFVDGGWIRGKFGFSQGFDVYDDVGGGFASIGPKAQAWLDGRSDEPFFLFVHSYDVHSQRARLPYDCPGGFAQRYTSEVASDFDGCMDGRCATRLLKWINSEAQRLGRQPGHASHLGAADIERLRALYDGCINYADAQVALLVDHLRHRGLLDRTLLVITSDHGEEFFEHGLGLHAQGAYDSVAHIPLLLRWPDGRFAGRRVPHLGAMIDLMPTLLDILDQPLPEEAQGRSLIPAVLDGQPVRHEVHMYSTLRTDRWKLITKTKELYDLEDDPAERVNRWESDPAIRSELEQRLRRLTSADRASQLRLHTADEQPKIELDESEIRKLKALGYL